MKTEELVAALARQPEAVDPRAPARRFLVAALLGVAGAALLMLWRLGINPELASDALKSMFWVKGGFVASVAVASAVLVGRLARPGIAVRRAAPATALPFVLLWVLAAFALLAAAPGERMPLVLGSSWNTCPLNIVMLALPALALLLAAMRTFAPTRLRLTGAATGLLAGALGTLVYLLHCPELAAPFLAIWYVLGLLIPAAVGALLGRAVLRW